MSRTKSFVSGVFFAYLYQGSAMLLGLWLTPLYLRLLGAHDYGVWLVGLQVLTFLLVCDLGVVGVLPRDVAHANGRELAEAESEELQILIGRTTKVVLAQTVLIALVALLLFLFRPGAASGLRGPVSLVLFTFVATYPARIFPAVLQGLQDLKFLGQLRMWLWGLSAVLTIVLLLTGGGFYALAAGWCLQEVGANLVTAFRLRRMRPDLVSFRTWRKTGPFKWRWLTRGLWVSVGQTATSLVGGTDLLIIARALGPVTVVVYSCTAKLVQVLQNQPQALASNALPGLSHMKTSESRDRIRTAATCLAQAMILVAGAVFCLVFALNHQFVNLWIGPRYFGGVALTMLLLLNFMARLLDYTLALSLFAFGHERMFAIRALVDGVVSVAVASILVRTLGLPGVVLGFACGALLVAIPMDLFIFAREFELTIREAIRPYVPSLWRIGAVGAASFAILRRIQIPNLPVLMLAGASVILLYLLVVVPHVRGSELGGYIHSATEGFRAGMRTRVLGWSNNS
jgi:O-antigen/teichoic acid export membrane protein